MYFKNNFNTGFSRGNKTQNQGDLPFLPLVLTVNVPWGHEAKKGLTGQYRIQLHSNQVVDNGWHSDNRKLAEKLVQAGLSGCKCGLGYLGVLREKSSLLFSGWGSETFFFFFV